MATTEEHLAALKDARAKGARVLQRDGERVEYRSLAEMDQIIATLEAEIRGVKRRGVARQMTPKTVRGF